MKIKNKIILIGNGFDLAHGFKTSFFDLANFIINHKIAPDLKDVIVHQNNSNSHFFSNALKKINIRAKKIDELGDDFYNNLIRSALDNDQEILNKYLKENLGSLDLILSNKFLSKLYKTDYNNWFDIENSYFSELKNIKKSFDNSVDFSSTKIKLERLNRDFEQLKEFLMEYLESIEIAKNSKVDEFLKKIFRDAKNVYIVNFNYTKTIEQYIDLNSSKTIFNINYIHGSIINNDIILGYGNDQNEDYIDIKNTEIDEFLEHFKTFQYLSKNYYERLHSEAINSFPSYEIHVIGHSLGSTDKTLLDEIMNTSKCEKIHLYKRGDLSNDKKMERYQFNKLLFSASRIFTDEKALRKKIINYITSPSFP
ncbi:AbiH family protein [Psychroserpens damuponensis]|uniref:AbiH family protein n=1 Tax=Psychroserpens damuponensis TaxID=943936 RepID=UPI000A0627E5|nr:AbiH family protein [Psychroserpens damuponensis]